MLRQLLLTWQNLIYLGFCGCSHGWSFYSIRQNGLWSSWRLLGPTLRVSDSVNMLVTHCHWNRLLQTWWLQTTAVSSHSSVGQKSDDSTAQVHPLLSLTALKSRRSQGSIPPRRLCGRACLAADSGCWPIPFLAAVPLRSSQLGCQSVKLRSCSSLGLLPVLAVCSSPASPSFPHLESLWVSLLSFLSDCSQKMLSTFQDSLWLDLAHWIIQNNSLILKLHKHFTSAKFTFYINSYKIHGLEGRHLWGSTPFTVVSLGWGPRIPTSNKFLRDAPGSGATLREVLL